MIKKNSKGFWEFQIFKKFPEVIHGISTRKFGDMKILPKTEIPVQFLKEHQKAVKNLQRFTELLEVEAGRLVTPEQKYGSKVKKVEVGHDGVELESPFIVSEADGVVTNQRGVFLFVAVADCFPILAYDPVKKNVGIAHAGWKGIGDGICENLIFQMLKQGVDVRNIIVGIGPGICRKCYEVKSDVASKFKFIRKRYGQLFLDLEAEIFARLDKLSVERENIEIADICVFENQNFYSARRQKAFLRNRDASTYSFRREGKNLEGEQIALIGLKR